MKEEKHFLYSYYWTNIFILVLVFYLGVHWNEEEISIIAQFRSSTGFFEHTSQAYALTNLVGSCLALYIGKQTFKIAHKIGTVLLILASFGLFYSLYILVTPQQELMGTVLLVYGPYTVGSMWGNVCVLMNKT